MILIVDICYLLIFVDVTPGCFLFQWYPGGLLQGFRLDGLLGVPAMVSDLLAGRGQAQRARS
jgi:hypothetical protein